MRSFATQWARKFSIVAIFLIGAFIHDVVIDALLAKRVQTIEAFRALVALQANLTCQELVVDLLRELVAPGTGSGGGGGCGSRGGHCCGVYLADVNGGCVVTLSFLPAAIPTREK